MSIESEVLSIIKPSKEDEERLHKIADSLMLEARDYISRNNIDADVRFVGSFSKGTYLMEPDLDLFILFPETTPKDEIVRIGLKIIRLLCTMQIARFIFRRKKGCFYGLFTFFR